MDYRNNKKLNKDLLITDCKRKNEIIESKNYGKFKILGRVTQENKYAIEFLETGFQTLVQCAKLKSGNIKDLYKPNVYKKGYNGLGPFKQSINGKDTKEYILWSGILSRCYSKQDKYNYPIMSDEWLCFQNFCNDIKNFDSYDLWRKTKNFQLDKDLLQQNKTKNKIYSKETCLFLTIQENQDEKNLRINKRTIIATRIKDNFEVEFKIISKFAKKYNLIPSKISACVLKKNKTHKGWEFKIKP